MQWRIFDAVGGFLSLAKLYGNSRDKYLICAIVNFSRGRKPFFLADSGRKLSFLSLNYHNCVSPSQTCKTVEYVCIKLCLFI